MGFFSSILCKIDSIWNWNINDQHHKCIKKYKDYLYDKANIPWNEVYIWKAL